MDRLPEGLRNPSKKHLEFDAKSVSKWGPELGQPNGPLWGLAPRRSPRGSQEVLKVPQGAFLSQFWTQFAAILAPAWEVPNGIPRGPQGAPGSFLTQFWIQFEAILVPALHLCWEPDRGEHLAMNHGKITRKLL